MQLRFSLLMAIAAAALLAVPATASAYFVHVISRGETLSSVAAADGLSVDQLAAANGLSATAQLVAGETIQIPPQQSSGGISAASESSVVPVSTTTASSGGAYVVQPGDTLTGIAARSGVSPSSLAAANGLDPSGLLVSGTVKDHLESGFLIAGTPKQVIAKLREQLAETRPGSLIMMPNQGRMSHETSKQSIRLMGEEVLPALREISKELGLTGPFDIDMPVSLKAALMAIIAMASGRKSGSMLSTVETPCTSCR